MLLRKRRLYHTWTPELQAMLRRAVEYRDIATSPYDDCGMLVSSLVLAEKMRP